MRTLVLSSGNPAMEDALLRAGHDVIVVIHFAGIDEHRRRFPGLSIHGISNWNDDEEIARVARNLPENIEAVATVDEQAVRTAGVLRELLGGLPGLSAEDATAYTDKAVMKDRCNAAGVPVARHRVVHHATEISATAREIGWPVVVKPRISAATLNTFVVRDDDDLERHLKDGLFDRRLDDPFGRFAAGEMLKSLHERENGFLVEEFLDVSREYFCNFYQHRGETLWVSPGYYSNPLIDALTEDLYFMVLPPDGAELREVAALCERATAALGAQTGGVHCEVLRTRDGKLWFGEAGARLPGAGLWYLENTMYGLDGQDILAKLAVDERPEIPLRRLYDSLVTVNLDPPSGIVRNVASIEEIEAIDGVVEVDMHLEIGRPVPGALGSLKGAGRIVYQPRDPGAAESEVKELYGKLNIQIDQPETLDPGA